MATVHKSFFQSIRLPLDVFLNVRRLEDTSIFGCQDNLGHQFRVSNPLSALHDSDYSSLGFEVAVRCNAFVGLFVFFFGFFGLDLVDLDPILGIRKVGIDNKCIVIIHLLSFWRFCENPIFCTSEGL